MTKEELITELKKEYHKKPFAEVLVAAYNLALQNAISGSYVLLDKDSNENYIVEVNTIEGLMI